MTPAERDEIRKHAERLRRVCSGSECSVECRTHRAVLAYVPPGDVQAPAGITIKRNLRGEFVFQVAGYEDDGATAILLPDADHAERLAWAVLAEVAQARAAGGKGT